MIRLIMKNRKTPPLLYSLFPKLLLTFAVITIPIFLASFWLNRRAEQITREQILALTSEQMRGNIGRFDEQVQILYNLGQYVCSNNSQLRMLANLPDALSDYELGESIRDLYEEMVQMRLGIGIVEDIRVHLKIIGKTVSTTSNSVVPLDKEEYGFVMGTPLSARSLTIYGDRLLMFSTSAENMDYEAGVKDSSFFLVMELSGDEIMQYMTQGDGPDSSVLLFVSDDRDFVLGSRNDSVTAQIVERVMAQPDFVQDIMTVDGTRYVVLRQESEMTGLNLIKYVNFDENFSMFSVYRYWMVAFIFIVLAAVIVFSLMVYRMVHKPINELSNAFRKVEKGDFNVSIRYERNDEFRYLYHRFERMVENTRNLIEQVYEQKILSQRSELKQLQSQINPHFLYNSFFIISLMARKGDMEFVENFTSQLGKYFQFIVKNDREMIPLSEELLYAGLYADIQMTRFSNRIKIIIEDAPERYRERMVPRLIIQPLIENALAYGLEKRQADGRLWIYFREKETALVIYVEDNGEAITEETLEVMRAKLLDDNAEVKMSGLYNIHRRLAIQYGGNSGLAFECLPAGGLRVILTIEFGDQNGR